jgi:hypothetical protein
MSEDLWNRRDGESKQHPRGCCFLPLFPGRTTVTVTVTVADCLMT